MADSDKSTDQRVSWDIFYVGEYGFGEHLQVIAPDSKPIIEGRPKLLEWLKSIGAKPQPRDIPFASKTPVASRPAPADPMMQAAQQVLGATITRTCAIHNTAMKRIPGTAETGKIGRNGKPYPAFWVCEAVEGCRGE